jgi:hypothetical protein
MEQLFMPCDRLVGLIPRGLNEHELAVGIPTFTNELHVTESPEQLISFLEDSVLWLSKRVYIVNRNGDRALHSAPDFRSASACAPQLSLSFRTLHSHRQTLGSGSLVVWLQTANEEGEQQEESDAKAIRQVVDLLLSLLQSWKCISVRLQVNRGDRILYTSNDSFAMFTAGPTLKELELINVNLLGSQCRILGHVQGEQMKLTLWDVIMSDMAVFSAGLAQNLGPTKMEVWTMLGSSGLDLLATFSKNTRLKQFVCGGAAALQSENIDLIVAALTMNQGLEHLKLSCSISSYAWAVLWNAIERHPALIHADIRNSCSDIETTCIRDYTRVVAGCMKTNEILQKIDISSRHRDDNIWRQLVLPALETNKYRPRFESVWKIDSHDQRDAVIAKALASVQTKPHLLYLALYLGRY